jgi:pimeloyl-ACP methyl ester carboxylesterase
MLETRIETTGGNKPVRLARLGAGSTVIMLHGYPENLQVFEKLATRLAKHYEVIAFDWPGMGYSEDRKGGATPLVMAKKLLALMDEWGIETADLVAQDMGGQPALVFAAEYPHRVRSVVVMNSLVAGDSETSWEIKWLRKFGINKLLLRHFGRLVFWRALFTFLPRGFALDPGLRRDMWQSFRRPGVRQYIVRMCAGYEAQLKRLPEYYARIKCPVFILWGEKDKHFPPVQAEKLQRHIPHAQMNIVEGADHWMVLTMPDLLTEKIERFFSTINTSANKPG